MAQTAKIALLIAEGFANPLTMFFGMLQGHDGFFVGCAFNTFQVVAYVIFLQVKR